MPGTGPRPWSSQLVLRSSRERLDGVGRASCIIASQARGLTLAIDNPAGPPIAFCGPVTQTSIPGPLQKDAWRVGGPGFAGGGVGARYAFSQRIAFTMALKVSQTFGGGIFAIGPEVGLFYGF